MKILKLTLFACLYCAFILGTAGLTGCATTKQTEQLLTEVGFKSYPADTEAKLKHLMSLPQGQITIARIKGKAYYVFPDQAHKLVYVGNAEEFQTYQQIVSYRQLSADSRVMAFEDEGSGDDTAKWAAWTPDTGWTGGSY